MQGIALKDLEIDVGTMSEDLKILGQVDDADRKAAKQSVTHLQHKVESALQDRLAAHQLLQKRIQLAETRVTDCEKLQNSLTAMQEDLSSVQDVQRQLLAIVTDMGESLDTLVPRDRPASPSAAEDRVADSASSRAGARGLSPLVEKDEEDEDWVSKGLQDLGQEKTTMKAFPSGAAGGSLFSEGHHSVSPPKVQMFGGPNTSGDASTSKQVGKVPLGRDVRGKEREKLGTGKKLERNAFFPFPFLYFLTNFFSRFWRKSSRTGEKRAGTAKKTVERCGTVKNGRSTPFQIVEFGEIPFFCRLKSVSAPIPTRFFPRSNSFLPRSKPIFAPFHTRFFSRSCTA